ncbi:TetR/AcrR family transcriptional regulator [Hymenobacter taeanensis]|uniref:TetR/AcrR family transcriptional regulator n=1 Tax=Hymenobacter taeanensis TaxID=2735321 RepID=A0A6M6BFV1_9BACT|nr:MULTISPECIES: TetR/AcrR family transcriptional regulator [Hymenobacter]QJX47097.1 TetR/AcrR family transcriptional regulator [Hymenobacter taeanensis]UOQ80976.1 TetR/AcrR family transcriptional regulator [Hymenobacter sp. 5414T-23]
MEVKDRILQAALGLFTRNGIKSVSMDDIATHLGISKKTLYKWFENKDQIVSAVIASHLNGVQGECEGIIGKTQNAVDEMVQMMDWAERQFAEVNPNAIHDLRKYYPEAWSLFHAHKNNYILTQIQDNLRRGVAEGLYRADLDIEVLSRLRLAQIDILFDYTLFPPTQFKHGRVQTACSEHFLLGMVTLKGHKLINEYRHVTEEE